MAAACMQCLIVQVLVMTQLRCSLVQVYLSYDSGMCSHVHHNSVLPVCKCLRLHQPLLSVVDCCVGHVHTVLHVAPGEAP